MANPNQTNWLEFFQTHQKWLASVIYVRIRDAHAVEEILQETALAAVNNAPVSLPMDAIPKWLYRVAVRQTLMYRRKLGRESRKNDQYKKVCEQQNKGSGNPVALLISLENQELVRSALSRMAPRDAEILIFKYCENLSCKMIAERVGASETAVKSRLLRARIRLVKEVERYEPDRSENAGPE